MHQLSLRDVPLSGARAVLAVVLGALTLSASSARANGRFPAASQLAFHPLDADAVTVRVTFGILASWDGGTTWRWSCEEAIGLNPNSAEDPTILRMPSDALIVTATAGLRVETGRGCAYEPARGVLGTTVAIDVVRDPSDASAAWVVTSAGAGANGVWRTEDDGASWRAVGPRFDRILFETIEVAPSDASRLTLSGAIPPMGSVPRQIFVYRSLDAGVSWDVLPFASIPGDRNLFLAAVDPAEPERLYARVWNDLGDRLVVSEDGGAAWRVVLTLPQMTGFARSDDGQTIWASGQSAGVWRSEDRGEHFEQVSAIHPLCLASRGSELWACGANYVDGFAVARSRDGGATWEPMLRFSELAGIPECDPASVTTRACKARFGPLRTALGGGLDAGLDASRVELDAGPRDDGGLESPRAGCGCRAVPGGALPWPAVLLGGAIWRARRRLVASAP